MCYYTNIVKNATNIVYTTAPKYLQKSKLLQLHFVQLAKRQCGGMATLPKYCNIVN